MISKIEKEFYKVFEIPPATIQEYGSTYFWDTIEIDGKRYTPINDRMLLELICIIVKTQTSYAINKSKVRDIKNAILRKCINLRAYIVEEVQQLFRR